MSKSMNMLRTRRRDNNVKPNRRLDRKSSRGMIYENEELRLKTININAEIERGHSDIKKLRRENEMLKKEIWYLRDEYEKLDKLLKQKEDDFTSSSSTCSSDSEASMSEDAKEVETSQNLENVQKTNLKNLQAEFDHLSVVPEEPSTENSDKSRTSVQDADLDELDEASGSILQPDQGYPGFPMAKHFFAPLPSRPMTPPQVPHFYTFRNDSSASHLQPEPGPSQSTKHVDLIVKTDNRHFNNLGLGKLDAMQMLEAEHLGYLPTNGNSNSNGNDTFPRSRSSFSNGGNLEELLNDIQTISEDILKISNPGNGNANGHIPNMGSGHYPLEKSSFNGNVQSLDRLTVGSEQELLQEANRGSLGKDLDKYKSEISVVLMPTPMPLLGFEKYQNLVQSSDKLNLVSPSVSVTNDNFLCSGPAWDLSNSSDQLTSDVEVQVHKDPKNDSVSEEDRDRDRDKEKKPQPEKEKLSIRRKVSIHFKGRKDKDKDKDKDKCKDDETSGTKKLRPPALTISSATSDDQSSSKETPQTPVEAPIPPPLNITHPPTPQIHPKDSSDSEHPTTNTKPNHNKSTSASPERHDTTATPAGKKHHKHKKKKKDALPTYLKARRNTLTGLSADHLHRERSLSIGTDRGPYTDEYLPSSERERTNSLSSCGTNAERNRRKFSTISRIPSGTGGKIPWCACWGNGCL